MLGGLWKGGERAKYSLFLFGDLRGTTGLVVSWLLDKKMALRNFIASLMLLG